MKTANYWIDSLQLQPHPEGGWFKEIYCSGDIIPKENLPGNYSGDRSLCTSIYYLLKEHDFSTFHCLKSDEIWHFHTGNSGVEIVLIENEGITKKRLGVGHGNFQAVIPKETWFAAHLENKSGYALVGCTVSPGFHFDDFTMGSREELLKEFAGCAQEIISFTK